MKILVKTTGDFQLLVEGTSEVVRSHTASVVTDTPWVRQHEAGGKIEVLEEVGLDADNAAWDDTLSESEGDFDLARKSFASEFPVKKDEVSKEIQALPVTNTSAHKPNPSGQTAGLSPDEKPGAPGSEKGPGGPKDTNVPKAAATTTHKR